MWHKNINKRSSTQAGTLGIPTGPWSMRWWRLTGPSSRCGTDTTTMTTPCTTTSHNLHQYSRKNPTCTLVLLQVWGNIYLKTSRDKVCRCGTSRSCPLCCYCVQLTVSERNVSSEYRMFLGQVQNEQNPLKWQKNSVQFFLWLLHVTKPEVKERCTVW